MSRSLGTSTLTLNINKRITKVINKCNSKFNQKNYNDNENVQTRLKQFMVLPYYGNHSENQGSYQIYLIRSFF